MSKRVSKINLHQIGGHRYLNSKYIIFFAFHVISEDHVMKDLTFPAGNYMFKVNNRNTRIG